MNINPKELINGAFKQARVIYYHDVWRDEPGLYNGGISVSRFEEQIKILIKAGAKFLSLDEAFEAENQGLSVCLTTDDGFVSNYENILPLLRKYSIPLTMFLLGQCIDNRELAWNHRLMLIRKNVSLGRLQALLHKLSSEYDLNCGSNIDACLFSISMERKDDFSKRLWKELMPYSEEDYLAKHQVFLSSAQIVQMHGEGVEIGIHSFSHPDFGRLRYAEMREEIGLTVDRLREIGIDKLKYFSFPYGRECSADLLEDLLREFNLRAAFGGRFSTADNMPGKSLWQRQKMEQGQLSLALELGIKPLLRTLKDSLA